MSARVRSRRGAALPLALVLLTVGSALSIGAAAAMQASVRASRAPVAALRARSAAEAALAVALARWQPAWATSLPQGASVRVASTTAAGDAVLTVLRLDADRYLLAADARSRTGAPGADGQAARAVGVFVRLARVAVTPPAALVSGGPVLAPQGVQLRGTDAPPDGWTGCPGAGGDVADLAVARAEDSASVHRDALVDGTVAVTAIARADSLYDVFGDVTWDALVRRADVVVLAGGVVSPMPRADAAGCVRDPDGWGEPRRDAAGVRACADFFPVVHVRGAGVTRLRGPARMQGMLLVDGDLEVEGDVEVAGLVIVRGALRASGAALRVTGALLVRQRAPAAPGAFAAALGAGSAVRHSRCAVTTVTLAASRPVALGRRAWVDVTR